MSLDFIGKKYLDIVACVGMNSYVSPIITASRYLRFKEISFDCEKELYSFLSDTCKDRFKFNRLGGKTHYITFRPIKDYEKRIYGDHSMMCYARVYFISNNDLANIKLRWKYKIVN